ncbi:amiloride-sensitive cation channel neuronal [Lynx pardinus]|uniref:Amiloride-sensitive cation channel neuronal n=1 Tax=Lynx pardinus TaxID=191816 RepID=A0A485N8Y7_LYNPA|nr:amiloride-sensitive cation channel neuronal [Lynx pardinus]
MDLKESPSEGSLQPSSIHIFANTSTLHGIRHIFVYGPMTIRRVLWAVAFVGSLGLLLVESSERVSYYLSYQHVTKVDEVVAQSLVFPAVTLCNLNGFRFSRLTTNDLYHAGELLALLDVNLQIPDPHLADPTVLEALRQKANFKHYKPKQFSMLEFLHRVGHDLKDMMLYCKFKGQECGHQDFTTVFTKYGKCYMFNSGEDGKPLLTTVKGGTGNGLEIMLDIQQDEYLPIWGETEETTFEAGVKVQIHSQSEPPFIQELGFGVAPGFQTFVATQEQRLTYLPPPWGECRSSEMGLDFFPVYSITACRIDCETRYIVENCNCRMVHMPGDAPFCTPEQHKECAEPALGSAHSDALCPPPQSRTHTHLDTLRVPTLDVNSHLPQQLTVSEASAGKNLTVLSSTPLHHQMSFEGKATEKVRGYQNHTAGDIGGQMGLFIGASILTILELFDYIYELIKEKLLDLLGKEEDEGSHDENVSTCDTMPNHSETISHTVNVPLQTALGTLEEIAC